MSHFDEVLAHFDRLSARGDWSRLYEIADGTTYHFHVRKARVLQLLPERLGRVLDVGCGPGVMVESVLARGGTLEGIDVSPEMVREASRRFGDRSGVRFRVGDVECLETPSDSYDQIVCMGVIEYLASPAAALREIARTLKPGGLAAVTIPKRRHIDHLALALTAPFRALGRRLGLGTADRIPRLLLQPDELETAARQVGLENTGGAHYYFTPLPYPFTRFGPGLSMRVNARFERLHATRNALVAFLAHGYVGLFRKPFAG